jgi:hypothetical protein
VAIPIPWQGSHFPDWLLARRKGAGRALTKVVARLLSARGIQKAKRTHTETG